MAAIWPKVSTEASTGAAGETKALMLRSLETSTGVLAWVRVEILLTESAEPVAALTMVFADGAYATPTARCWSLWRIC